MNCPHCNRRVRLIAATTRTSARQTLEASWTNASEAATLTHVPERTPDYSRTPVRAPTLQSDVFVILAQAGVSGFITFAGTSALAFALEVHKPLMFSSTAGFVTLAFVWQNGLTWTRDIIHRVEERIGRDIDGDNAVGEPPRDIINPIPVYTPRTQRAPKGTLTRLRPSDRTIDTDKLCDYLAWAFINGWTRDKAQAFGLGQKEWPDVRDFVDKWGLWGTSDRPALDGYIDSLHQR